MTSTETPEQRSPLPRMHKIELVQPGVMDRDITATSPHRPYYPPPLRTQPRQATVTVDDLRRRAYAIYLRRGGNPGDHLSDWLRAERELSVE
jgi:hypothetical protein